VVNSFPGWSREVSQEVLTRDRMMVDRGLGIVLLDGLGVLQI